MKTKMKEKEFTFHNVRITVSATDGKKAYNRLCAALGAVADDWETDTYSEEDSKERLPTCDVFPWAETDKSNQT